MASLSGTLATMGPGVPYAIAAKFAHPDRPVIALVGDGAMQMNGNAELVTIAKYCAAWSDPRLVVLVLNNNDLNQVTWEQRAMEGDPQLRGLPGAARLPLRALRRAGRSARHPRRRPRPARRRVGARRCGRPARRARGDHRPGGAAAAAAHHARAGQGASARRSCTATRRRQIVKQALERSSKSSCPADDRDADNVRATSPVERLSVAAYTVPTDAPEADGTFAWDATTIVVVRRRGGGERGLGYTYADRATARLDRRQLAGVVRGATRSRRSGRGGR